MGLWHYFRYIIRTEKSKSIIIWNAINCVKYIRATPVTSPFTVVRSRHVNKWWYWRVISSFAVRWQVCRGRRLAELSLVTSPMSPASSSSSTAACRCAAMFASSRFLSRKNALLLLLLYTRSRAWRAFCVQQDISQTAVMIFNRLWTGLLRLIMNWYYSYINRFSPRGS